MHIEHVLVVGNCSYLVTEQAGYFKAHLNGQYGWASVWADNLIDLVRRIQKAKNGGQ